MSLQEYYNSSGSRDGAFVLNSAGYQGAQTFTPSVGHKISSIRIFCYADGTSGTTYIMLKATSSGAPTGSALTYALVNNSDLPSSYGWITVEVTPYTLVAGTTYAICVGPGSLGATVRWGGYSAGGYSGGNAWFSSDAGSNWSTSAPLDVYFEEYSKDDGGLFFCLG